LQQSNAMFVPAIVNDEAYLATQLDLLQGQPTIEKAIKDFNLTANADFQNKNEAEIARMALGKIQCTRRRGTYLIDVSVIGPDPKVLDDLTNALVDAFHQMQRSETKSMREDRKAALDENIAQAESQIRLAGLDKQAALQGASFTEATFEAEW